MTNFELVSFASDEELAQAVAGKWLQDVQAAAGGGAAYCVALSGGRIARRFFAATATLAQAQRLALNAVHFFWGDERCVPPTDPESNFGLARELLLAPLAVPERQVHRVRGEAAPEVAAREAASELCRIAPRDPDGQPVLDLIFLGMGEDGHVASLFPGESEELMSSDAVYRSVIAAKPPPHRITIGYLAIGAARQVWVLASGAGKEAALRASLAAGGQTPLARVLKLRAHTRIFTDVRLKGSC